MKTIIKDIQFDFTNHFSNPYNNIKEEEKEEIIKDCKRILWDSINKNNLINQIELTYGFEVKEIIFDYKF